MAMEDAGYGDGRAWDRTRASVILGVTGTQELVISLGARLGHPKWRRALEAAGVDPTTAADVVARIGRSYVGWQESSFPGLLGNVVAGRIANRLDLGGTNCVLDAACASSLAAVHLAVLELCARKSDLVLTGGVDCLNDIFMHMCFSKTPALSASGDVRPFSEKADGTLLGEGLGMVVLKRLADAERDGDRVYAVILGVGTSSDGRARSVYAPLPTGQARALRTAYASAGVRPADVTLIEAHGTGTKAGDLAEFEALRTVFREDSDAPAWCTLGTIKSQLGHTKAAAGAAGMIKAALALHHKVLPPTLKVDRPHPALQLGESPFTLTAVAQPWLPRASGPRLAGVSSFGFGGSNYHLVLGERSGARQDAAWDGSVEILALSADDAPALVAAAEAFLRLGAEEARSAIRRSRETFDARRAHRLLAVIPDGGRTAELLRPALDRITAGPRAAFQLPATTDGAVSYGTGTAEGEIAFLFPGQGSQHVGMLRELSCVFPELLAHFDAAPEVARAIYPLSTFDEVEAARRQAHLTRTDVAQQALGLVSLGLCDLLRKRFGLQPGLAAGHSYGELPALHAAGVLDADGLLAATRARGSLMLGDGTDRGTMIAVLAKADEIERLIADEALDVVLANRNGPEQGVLSGPRAAIDRAAAACQARGLRAVPLSVGAAFHSPLVAHAAEAFRGALEGIAWSPAAIPVIADSTAEPYPADGSQARDTLAQQLARPVRFDEVVLRLHAMGARSFVEVGPKATLTRMVRAILRDRPFTAVAVDPGGARGALFDLAQLLTALAAAGHVVDLAAWEQGSSVVHAARKQKMSVSLTGANHRSPVDRAEPPPVVRPPALAAGRGAALQDVLLAQQEGIRALQAMQEQTARVHQVFLEGQRAAHQSLQALLGAPVSPAPLAATSAVEAPAFATVIPASRPVAAEATRPDPGPAPEATPASEAVDVVPVLLAVVAQATGYPEETLSLDMGMEADLGIDSIKRVEILSMLAKRIPGAPSVNPERLSKLRTLGQVLRFVSEPEAGASGGATPANGSNGHAERVVHELAAVAAASLHRRSVVPVAAPAPADGRFALPEGPVVITADASGLAEALVRALAAAGRAATVTRPGDDIVGPAATLILLSPDEAAWTAESEASLKAALGLARSLGPRLRESGGQRQAALLVTISRRDGAFGLATRSPAWNPLQGGLAGLAKTAAHEWPEVRCRAVDVSAAWSLEAAARAVVSELSNPGPREVGLGPAGRVTLALRAEGALPLAHRFDPGGVVVVTGGARGVTAACARRLASRTDARLALLGRTPAPTDEPSWLREATTEADIKRACLDHAPPDSRPTPKALGEACRAVVAGREIRATLEALDSAGVRATYRSVDVRDARTVAATLAEIRASFGPIQGVVHGAGVLRDRRIEDKRDLDFDEVLDPKLAGLRSVLEATREDDLRCLVLFASATGRFGRRGQSDYAVANQALASIAQVEARRRPCCRVVAIDWGPWEGGMVTPALQTEFEREGVPLIALDAGADAMCDEALGPPGGPTEVVLGGGAGSDEPAGWFVAGTWRLDASTFPVLRDHGLAGKAVLPLAITMEWFVAAATAVSGGSVTSLDDVRVFRGVAVGADPCDVSVWARPHEGHDEGDVVQGCRRLDLELRGGADSVYVRAVATLGRPVATPTPAERPEGLRGFGAPIDRVYAEQLFHGPSLEAIEGIEGMGESGMVLRLRAHPTSERLLPGPALAWAVDPLVLDGVFQALIIWCRAHVGAPSLPSRVASLRVFAPITAAVVRAVVRIRVVEGLMVTADVELLDLDGTLFARLDGYVCTASPSLERAFAPEQVATTPLPA